MDFLLSSIGGTANTTASGLLTRRPGTAGTSLVATVPICLVPKDVVGTSLDIDGASLVIGGS